VTIEEGKNWLIDHCQRMFKKNIAGSVFTVFGVLMEAEEQGLIKRNWRSKLDVNAIESFIKRNQSDVEHEWQREFRQLKRITDYGGYMEYEEMILILSLRSDLESGLRFVEKKSNHLLANLDEDLRAVLKLNREYTRDSRNSSRKHTGGLETYLSNHWWWRYDEEN
jgi:hypothetical protein